MMRHGTDKIGNSRNSINQNLLAYSGDGVVAGAGTMSDDDSKMLEPGMNTTVSDDNLEASIKNYAQSEILVKSDGTKISLFDKFKSLGDEWSEAETKPKKILYKSVENPENQLDPDEDDDDGKNECKGMDKIS